METTTVDRACPATESPAVDVPAAPPAPPRHAIWPLSRAKRRAPASFRRRFFRDVARGMGIVVLLHVFVLQISVVRGHSMKPFLMDGDRLVIDRLTYSFADVDRFDVVVLKNPRNPSVDYVKRIVGIPGDRIRLLDGELMINDQKVDESFGPIHDQDTTIETVVPQDHYFVLGDNRPISCDSREFGLVRAELLRGKVRVRFWPLVRFGVF